MSAFTFPAGQSLQSLEHVSCLCLYAGITGSPGRRQCGRAESRGSTCRDTERERTAQGTAARNGQRSKCKSYRKCHLSISRSSYVSTLQIVLEDKLLISRRLSCLCLHAGIKWSLKRHQSSREEIRGSTCRDTERKRTAQGTAARSGQRSKCKSIRQKMPPFYFKVFL